jgi:hypothetical protein
MQEEFVYLSLDRVQSMNEDDIDERIDVQYFNQAPKSLSPSQSPELLNYLTQLLRVRFTNTKNLEDWMFKENMNQK